MNLAVVILAAGEGTRMKSDLPKVTHPICGKAMISHVVSAAQQLKPKRLILVLGHKKDLVASVLRKSTKHGLEYIVQKKQLGTGHAVLSTRSSLRGFSGTVLVLNGDVPLITLKTIKNLLKIYIQTKADATVLTTHLDNPTGYGRVMRNERGKVIRIVEERDATPKERKISEINTGTYCFKTGELFSALLKVRRENKQKEYYLTDVVEIMRKSGKKVSAFCAPNFREVLGINSRQELKRAEEYLQERINLKWLEKGVTIIDPASTFIGCDVVIGKDTTVMPFCFIEGKTRIGKECVVGPMARLIDTAVGNRAEVQMAVTKKSKIGKNAIVGPFCHIRPGTVVEDGAKIGSFVEVKKSKVGEKSKIPHLSYIGDAVIGRDVNIGAGTITCNYDGVKKHQTVIENGAFIGSDTQLIAPVRIGRDAVTGAGSVITSDVPDKSLALERCSQKTVKDWSKKKRKKK